MAMGRYSRVDGKKSSSSFGLTITIVLIVSLSLVGAWMFMSSWSAPTESIDFSSSQATTKDVETTSKSDFTNEKNEETEVVTESNQEKVEERKEFEDKNGEGDRKNEKDTESESEKEKTQVEESSEENKTEENTNESEENAEKSKDVFPAGDQAEITKESTTRTGSWSTQLVESQNEKKAQVSSSSSSSIKWKLCNVTAGPDYIPCLDNLQAIRKLHSTKHYEHRERHCPEEAPRCLVPLPEGYKRSIKWPKSREKIWYNNIPHTKLAQVKGHQNWVKMSGEYLTFPGGGTQFKNGALHYIDFLQESYPDIAWGNRTRVILDVGCGVASFGGYLFDRDVLALSFAPKDEHEAQVQFALERGIPAMSNVMGTKRLPFPGSVFDLIHCARCRVPWHIEGGKLLLELNRALRPGGFFVWSATPVYRKTEEDVGIWKAMSKLTKAMCWKLMTIKTDELNEVGAAIYQKPMTNECYNERSQDEPPLCKDSDDQNAAWNVPLEACMHKVTEDSSKRGAVWPEKWPERVETAPQWLESQEGVYGKPAQEDFTADHERWKNIVSKSYLNGMGIDWSYVRNVMDMRAVYGGFAAALKDLKLWVMNVVPIDSADTLPIIYERGLFGIYHDWCESFSTYPRTYDLLHADHLFSALKKRCSLVSVMAEVDRILRPQGTFIVRDDNETVGEIEKMVKSMKWNVTMTHSKGGEGLLSVQKSWWRPTEVETITSAIA
ncbi:hypothetical protein HID58_030385 [Brassica napus]|uniref:Methyltransferase n=1 Tax=Brassica napus TaxID=3708 RepID=A0ABQ8CFS7_BRANA|nr:probable methyltransferase PMT24 [Brassica napus]XP_022545874.2 probable methyltransferase PMT24 [Brassica napus]KAH0915939.1 hypothetical protein HID58_030385 [Brassica napus]